jgi:hypothetical protein
VWYFVHGVGRLSGHVALLEIEVAVLTSKPKSKQSDFIGEHK